MSESLYCDLCGKEQVQSCGSLGLASWSNCGGLWGVGNVSSWRGKIEAPVGALGKMRGVGLGTG